MLKTATRRVASGAGRASAALVLFLALAISLGSVVTAIASAHPPGRLVDIGGRRLNLVCAGPADAPGPLVVFEAGAFGLSADFGAVQEGLAAKGVRSCAYDRAGLGRSDPGPAPRDSAAIVGDLEKLLAASGEAGPYVMVGHSMAGLHLRLFTARNRDKIAGLVLLDAAPPEAADLPVAKTWIGRFAAVSNVAGVGATLGLFAPLGPTIGDRIGLPPEAAKEKRRAFASGRHNRWAAREVSAWLASSEQGKAVAPYDPDLPVGVVTAGPQRQGALSDWKKFQSAPARVSKTGFHINIDEAGHANMLGLKHRDVIVDAILRVRSAAD
ncbi:alpha/beta fold hydrolase [Caulobacter sp. SLTY]|uniref:alpha/beta hydrolase n=1 Tax=Caulobacter sp. SLTY TaxID=2683262 RepID=UPI001412E487|nr:alpha/beta hydrolase family protein [Caulobacter sp. SLTY]NBB14123.1 alpha/beta fold hydrolase [Caulobacter sp. SLTY]